MSVDKTTPNIGGLLVARCCRDAIHIAVAPVEAVERMSPGDSISFADEGCELVRKAKHDELGGVGIADPFLCGRIEPGDRFYLFLYPGTITSLRHEWTHPRFRQERTADNEKSIRWLEEFAKQNRMSYEQVVAAAKDYAENGEYVIAGPDFYTTAETDKEYWYHINKITGIEPQSETPFSCSC